MAEYKFPDEEEEKIEVEQEPVDKVEIEVVDDRPEEDQKNATPLPKEIADEVENDDLEE